MIRTAFKDENSEYRHRSVGKLLYIHMLGTPARLGKATFGRSLNADA